MLLASRDMTPSSRGRPHGVATSPGLGFFDFIAKIAEADQATTRSIVEGASATRGQIVQSIAADRQARLLTSAERRAAAQRSATSGELAAYGIVGLGVLGLAVLAWRSA